MEVESDGIDWGEPTAEEDRLARAIIGAAIEVHRVLGPGLTEDIYERSLCIELNLRGLEFVRQPIFDVEYKGEKVGEMKLDLLVGGLIVVELKSVDSLAPVHKGQVITYCKVTKRKLGLLLNFNQATLSEGIRRIVLS